MKDKIIEILNKNLSVVDRAFGSGRDRHIEGIEECTELLIKEINLIVKLAAKEVRYKAIDIVQDYDGDTLLSELRSSICKDIQNINV